jgi:hypothetical protein
MINEMVDFRFSDSDLATYLILNGYESISIEVIYDKRNDRLKAFTHFYGDKDMFIKLQNEYENDRLLVNPKEFSKTRKQLNLKIKEKLNQYRNQNNL